MGTPRRPADGSFFSTLAEIKGTPRPRKKKDPSPWPGPRRRRSIEVTLWGAFANNPGDGLQQVGAGRAGPALFPAARPRTVARPFCKLELSPESPGSVTQGAEVEPA